MCFPGYAGAACESCAGGYIQNNGQCLPTLPIVSTPPAAAPDGETLARVSPLATWVWVAVVCGSLTMLALLVAAFYMARFKAIARIFTEMHLPRMSQMSSNALRSTIRQSQAGVMYAQDVHNKHSMHGPLILDDPCLERRQTGMVPQGSIMVSQLPQEYFSQGAPADASFMATMARRPSGGMLEPHYNYSATGGLLHPDHSAWGGDVLHDPCAQPMHHEPTVRMNPRPTVHLIPPRHSAFASAMQPSAPPMHAYEDARITGEVQAFFEGSSPSVAMARASGTGEHVR